MQTSLHSVAAAQHCSQPSRPVYVSGPGCAASVQPHLAGSYLAPLPSTVLHVPGLLCSQPDVALRNFEAVKHLDLDHGIYQLLQQAPDQVSRWSFDCYCSEVGYFLYKVYMQGYIR